MCTNKGSLKDGNTVKRFLKRKKANLCRKKGDGYKYIKVLERK